MVLRHFWRWPSPAQELHRNDPAISKFNRSSVVLAIAIPVGIRKEFGSRLCDVCLHIAFDAFVVSLVAHENVVFGTIPVDAVDVNTGSLGNDQLSDFVSAFLAKLSE